jgi:hypothetical protein
MIDVIQNKFTDISSKCLEKYAKQEGVKKTDVQLIFKLGQSGDAEYLIYKQYKPLKVLTFMEVLGVRIDFKGYSLFVPKFIRGALTRFCDEFKIPSQNVRVLLNFDDKGEMFMFLYNVAASSGVKIIIFVLVISSASLISSLICLEVIVEHLSHLPFFMSTIAW